MNFEISIQQGSGGSDVNDLAITLFSIYKKSLSKANIKYEYDSHKIYIKDKINKEQKEQLLKHNFIMRIVRVSPYCKKVQTSFLSISCIEQNDDYMTINEKDIFFQAIKSCKPGGQHVNKTNSAIRALHKSTGISVVSDGQRSQHSNKKEAVNMIKNKIYESKNKKQNILKKQKYQESNKATFGFSSDQDNQKYINLDLRTGKIIYNKAYIIIKCPFHKLDILKIISTILSNSLN